MGDWFHNVIWGGLMQTTYQLVYVAAPFFLLGLLLHVIEAYVQGRLSRQFGWNSILWTGWIGTPIHELSHAAMCPLFRHKIQEIALFKPDRASGRMGYVKHSFNPKSHYQTIGGFFIGTAPLLGGALVLYGLLWLAYPGAARNALNNDGLASAVAGGNVIHAIVQLFKHTLNVLSDVVTLKHVASLPFWLFLYGVLCVGSHLAPSRADYKGTLRGGIILLVLLLAFNVLFLALGGKGGAVTMGLASVLGPALALFILAAILCGLSALVVSGITGLLGGGRARRR